jgi:hypothetical protein
VRRHIRVPLPNDGLTLTSALGQRGLPPLRAVRVRSSPRSQVALGNALVRAVVLPLLGLDHLLENGGGGNGVAGTSAFPNGVWERGEQNFSGNAGNANHAELPALEIFCHNAPMKAQRMLSASRSRNLCRTESHTPDSADPVIFCIGLLPYHFIPYHKGTLRPPRLHVS